MSPVVFIYDDCVKVPQDIQAIIGTDHYAKVIKRQQTFVDIIADVVRTSLPKSDFVYISSKRDVEALLQRIENAGPNTIFFRMPSSLMPTHMGIFSNIVYKSSFALGNTLLGDLFHDEVVTILDRDNMLKVLKAQESGVKRELFLSLQDHADKMTEYCEFVDLRETSGFLGFMSSATEARFFNSAEIHSGVFRKSSTNKAKMKAEYTFFNLVAEPMRRFLMPTSGYTETDNTASYEMEHIAVPDAALQMIHYAFDPKSFDVLLERFFDYIASRQGDRLGVPQVRDVAQASIWGKVESRMAELLKTEQGQHLDRLMRDAGPMGDLSTVCARAKRLVDKAIALDTSDSVLMSHGDPCLSNILFDRRIGLFRLIDPRGGTQRADILMHPLYDIAKFSHSILGSYDFINNGLFDCQLDSQMRLTLRLHHGGSPQWMRDAFMQKLKAQGFDLTVVRAYELTLFLSMLPLHVDYPSKLPAFVLTACQIIQALEAS